MTDRLPDDLADALGLVIAEQQEHWDREHTAFSAELRAQLAEHRAVIAEQKSRIAELEAQLKVSVDEQIRRVDSALAVVKDGEPGRDGADAASVDLEAIARMVADSVAAALATLPIPKDGKSPTLEELAPAIEAVARRVVSEIPTPKNGQDGTPGQDGKDAEPITAEQVAAAVADALPAVLDEALARYFTANPPKDGRDGRDGNDAVAVDYDVIGRWIDEKVAGMPRPKDLAGAVIDRSGCLMLTLTDGSVRELGPVVGKDADPVLIEALVRDHISRIPAPKDGRDGINGKDGADGLGFDDYTEELSEDGRTRVRRWARGERVKEFREPVYGLRYCGVWKDGAYHRDDAVTWDGGVWIAMQDTSDKPEKSDAWKLAVRKGRDGKDGILKAEEPSKPIRLR